MKLIDTHCHVFPEHIAQKAVDFLQDYYGFSWEGSGLFSDIMAAADAAKISRTLLFSSATKPEQVKNINDSIAQLLRDHPGKFGGLGTIHPALPDWQGELKRLKSLGLSGIKLHPDFLYLDINAPEMMDIYACAADMEMIALFHVGDPVSTHSAPWRLAEVMEKVPDLTVIAAHLGGYASWDAAEKYLIGTPAYIDTSSAIPFTGIERARELILKHGTDRVLFASDYPAVYPGTAFRQLQSLGLPEQDMEKICHLNAEKLFQWN